MRIWIAVLLVGLASACGDSGAAYPACGAQLHIDQVTYDLVGFSDHAGRDLKTTGTCTDPSSAGHQSSGSPISVPVRALRGFSPDQVVTVRVETDAWAIFLATKAPHALLFRVRRSAGYYVGRD